MSDEVEGTEVEETEDGSENSTEVEKTEGEEQEEWTPPSRDEVEKLQRIAKARKSERDNLKRELAALREKESGEKEPDEASKWRATAARSAAAVALSSAGFQGSAKDARWLTALLGDLSQFEPDENGDFDFEDAIDDLKERLPRLFEAEKVPTAPRRKPTTSDRGAGSESPGMDKHTAALLKMAGYR